MADQVEAVEQHGGADYEALQRAYDALAADAENLRAEFRKVAGQLGEMRRREARRLKILGEALEAAQKQAQLAAWTLAYERVFAWRMRFGVQFKMILLLLVGRKRYARKKIAKKAQSFGLPEGEAQLFGRWSCRSKMVLKMLRYKILGGSASGAAKLKRKFELEQRG